MARLHADETPYHYAGNNPVLFNDPLGDKVSGGNMFSRMYDGFHAWQYGHSAQGFASWMDNAGFGGFGGQATGQGHFIGRPVEEIWMVSRYKNEDGSARDIIDEYFDHYVYEGTQQGPSTGQPNMPAEAEIYSLEQFRHANRWLTREQIKLQEGRQWGVLPKGPHMRYVRNPRDGRVIDMRHMIVVGPKGPLVGNAIEAAQRPVSYPGGGDSMDYYSNDLGWDFNGYRRFYKLGDPKKYADYLYDFIMTDHYYNSSVDHGKYRK